MSSSSSRADCAAPASESNCDARSIVSGFTGTASAGSWHLVALMLAAVGRTAVATEASANQKQQQCEALSEGEKGGEHTRFRFGIDGRRCPPVACDPSTHSGTAQLQHSATRERSRSRELQAGIDSRSSISTRLFSKCSIVVLVEWFLLLHGCSHTQRPARPSGQSMPARTNRVNTEHT